MTTYIKIHFCDEDVVLDKERFDVKKFTLVDYDLMRRNIKIKDLLKVDLRKQYIVIVDKDVYEFLKQKM